MSTKIITISRELGSGGRSVGKAVAERLGYAYYDKELVETVAAKTGLEGGYIDEQVEAAPASRFQESVQSFGRPGGVPGGDRLWAIQRRVMLDLAEKGPCVIVGRCSDFIFRDRADTLRVFVFADKEYRAARAVERYGVAEGEVEKVLANADKTRAANYKHFTGRDWGRAQNYDCCLNAGRLGEENCIDYILQLAQK